jgi:hypothetical protein
MSSKKIKARGKCRRMSRKEYDSYKSYGGRFELAHMDGTVRAVITSKVRKDGAILPCMTFGNGQTCAFGWTDRDGMDRVIMESVDHAPKSALTDIRFLVEPLND